MISRRAAHEVWDQERSVLYPPDLGEHAVKLTTTLMTMIFHMVDGGKMSMILRTTSWHQVMRRWRVKRATVVKKVKRLLTKGVRKKEALSRRKGRWKGQLA